MTEEEERKRAEDRRAWLGDPIEHGGEYRPSEAPRRVMDAGCCLLEAGAGIGLIAALALPAWFMLG